MLTAVEDIEHRDGEDEIFFINKRAVQWFAFTLILTGGYLKYIRRQQQPVSGKNSIPVSKPLEA